MNGHMLLRYAAQVVFIGEYLFSRFEKALQFINCLPLCLLKDFM